MKILIGLSGGLDSTYAAYLLKEAGHEVIGASVLMHEYTDNRAAKEAADAVGIPYLELDCRERFQEKVVKHFVSEYCRGRTPNPCIECNPHVKFAALCDYAKQNHMDAVATGHYSSVIKENNRCFIRRAEDEHKDQSYVLWRLSQKQLSMLCLPLAGMSKNDIREKARALGFRSADASESQEICFIPDHDYVAFLEKKVGAPFPPGSFIDREGKILGEHKGLVRYTIGQRKGLGISLGEPMFVSSLDPEKNTVTLVPSGEEYFREMTVGELNFMKLPPLADGKISATVRVRYSARPMPCSVLFSDGIAHVRFDSPVRAVTPGQSAVFYEGNDLLFGGIIEASMLS